MLYLPFCLEDIMYFVPQFSLTHPMYHYQRGLAMCYSQVIPFFKFTQLNSEYLEITELLPVVYQFFNMQVNHRARGFQVLAAFGCIIYFKTLCRERTQFNKRFIRFGRIF